MIRVTVLGASGLVGRVLVERLCLNESYSVRAVIHSSGNAWGLARSGMQLVMASLSSKEQLAQAIEGSTHVVNCVRPRGDAIPTTKNLLEVCSAKKVQRLVHLSSISVYGESPDPESIHENAPPNVKKRTYGWAKLQQDELIAKAHRNGLSCAILCPANITGMRSKYLMELVSALRQGHIALVDNGQRPYCSTDVVNLCSAIELALSSNEADGRRMYINDGQGHTWGDVIDGLMELADGQPAPASITEAQALEIIALQPAEEVSLQTVFKKIVGNASIRDLIQKNPTLAGIYRGLRSSSKFFPPRLRARLLGSMEGRFHVAPSGPSSPYDAKICMHQLRNVVPSTQRAQTILGYSPPLSFAQSMAMFRTWYKQAHGYGDEHWHLLHLLYPHV